MRSMGLIKVRPRTSVLVEQQQGGRNVTTVAKCAMDAQQGGASYVDREVVVDGNLVTARTWHDNTALLREFIRLLRDALTN